MNQTLNYICNSLIFGIDSRQTSNKRALPRKYFSVLLVKDSNQGWCLPNKIIGITETSKIVAKQMLYDFTGLENAYMEELMVSENINNKQSRSVSVSYMSLIDRTLLNHELMENTCWFDIILQEIQNRIIVTLTNGKESISYRVEKEVIDKKSNLYNYKVITECDLDKEYSKIVIEGIMRLRERVSSSDIAFNLMPELFTIGELKQVYELLLNKKLLNAAFRRVIADKVIVTKKQVKTGGHRPSYLCKYKD